MRITRGISFGSKCSNHLGVDAFCPFAASAAYLLLFGRGRNVERKTAHLLSYFANFLSQWVWCYDVLKWKCQAMASLGGRSVGTPCPVQQPAYLVPSKQTCIFTSAYTSAEQLILKRQLIQKLGSEKRGQITSSGGCK
jgi:hypothetical protein